MSHGQVAQSWLILQGDNTVTPNSSSYCVEESNWYRHNGRLHVLSRVCVKVSRSLTIAETEHFTYVTLFSQQQLIKSQEGQFAPFLIWKPGVVTITWVKQCGPMSCWTHLTTLGTIGPGQVTPGSITTIRHWTVEYVYIYSFIYFGSDLTALTNKYK